jgi:hypothetical protein
MIGRLPRIRRGITTATEAPTRLNRPDVAPVGSAEGRAGVEPVVDAAVSRVSVLITEQEVLFSSAAAVTIPSKKNARAWVGLLRLRRLVTSSTVDERAAERRHYSQHYVFLEQALMAREMERC